MKVQTTIIKITSISDILLGDLTCRMAVGHVYDEIQVGGVRVSTNVEHTWLGRPHVGTLVPSGFPKKHFKVVPVARSLQVCRFVDVWALNALPGQPLNVNTRFVILSSLVFLPGHAMQLQITNLFNKFKPGTERC